eukprot:815383-Alexandrium_andersonii.AAC.1
MVLLHNQASSVSDGLAGSDEAAQVLDKRDQALMKEAMDHKLGLESELKQFKEHYKEKVERHSSVSGARGKKGQAKSQKKKYPAKYPTGTIPHSDAKALAPEGSHVWRGLAEGTWQGHLPPFKRVSRSWARYTEQGALRLVLQDLWGNWLDSRGLDLSLIHISEPHETSAHL